MKRQRIHRSGFRSRPASPLTGEVWSRAANERHKNLVGEGVPLIIIGSHRMSGFSPQALEYYLNNSR